MDTDADENQRRLEDIEARLHRGESVPISEVEAIVGPIPRDRAGLIRELEELTGLPIDEIRRITGRKL